MTRNPSKISAGLTRLEWIHEIAVRARADKSPSIGTVACVQGHALDAIIGHIEDYYHLIGREIPGKDTTNV